MSFLLFSFSAADSGGTDKTKRSPSGLRVAFFASLTNDSTNMHTNQPIIFDHSDLNIGNAYSTQYGSFTAPRPGVYVFNVNLLPHVRVTDARLVKNGQILAKTHSERWKQSSQTVIVELQLGDHVSVNIDYQSNVSLYHDAYCTFSGFLLYDFTDTDALAVGK